MPDERKFYLLKLIAPRPSFPGDMTPEEGRVMREHVGYWTEQLGKGTAIVFGPVADPAGVWGLCVLTAENDAEVERLKAGDPIIRAGLGFRMETYPMLQAVARP